MTSIKKDKKNKNLKQLTFKGKNLKQFTFKDWRRGNVQGIIKLGKKLSLVVYNKNLRSVCVGVNGKTIFDFI